MGSALSVFNDFMTATDSAILTNADSIVNEAVKNNYLLRRFLRGKSSSQILQGGKTIKDQILFDEESTFQYYQANETFTWENPQVLEQWEINWRFMVDHMSWTDQEIQLNAGGGLSKGARHAVYKKLRRVKEQRLWTSMLNGMEDALFATPSNSEMETASGTKPYSIPCFINQNTNGLWSDGSGGSNDFATVQGIDSSVKTKWQNQVDYYSPTLDGTVAGDDATKTIFAAFDRMYLKTRFQAPPTRQEYFENDDMYAQFIACSRLGITTYMQALRNSQDMFAAPSRQDPAYLKPTYGGIELEYVAALDSAALYLNTLGATVNPENSGMTDDAGTGASDTQGVHGPRYYWLNGKYINPVFHSSRYFTRHDVMTHPNQPFTHVQPVDCWMNLVCRSRQRQGIVSPAAAYSGA